MCEEDGRSVWKYQKSGQTPKPGLRWPGGKPDISLGCVSQRWLPGLCHQDSSGVLRERSMPHSSGEPQATKGTRFFTTRLPRTMMSCEGGGGVPDTYGLFLGGALGTAFGKVSGSQVESASQSGWELPCFSDCKTHRTIKIHLGFRGRK